MLIPWIFILSLKSNQFPLLPRRRDIFNNIHMFSNVKSISWDSYVSSYQPPCIKSHPRFPHIFTLFVPYFSHGTPSLPWPRGAASISGISIGLCSSHWRLSIAQHLWELVRWCPSERNRCWTSFPIYRALRCIYNNYKWCTHTDIYIYVIYQVEVVKTGYKPANITGKQNVVIINSCSKPPQSKSETQWHNTCIIFLGLHYMRFKLLKAAFVCVSGKLCSQLVPLGYKASYKLTMTTTGEFTSMVI